MGRKRARCTHWKDSASETPEVKATTSMGGGGNRYLQSRRLTRDGMVVASAPVLMVSASDADKNAKSNMKSPSTLQKPPWELPRLLLYHRIRSHM